MEDENSTDIGFGFMAEAIQALNDKLEEMRCKNCRYWRQYPGLEDIFGLCASKKYEHDDFMRLDKDGYEIETGPDFGCIHWEGK